MTSRINKNVCVYVGMYEGLTTEILEWLRQHSGRWVSGVLAPHFNRDTVEFASRKGDESNPGIKTLMPFQRNITEESDLENFQDLIVPLDACYWLHKTMSISLSRFGDDRAI